MWVLDGFKLPERMEAVVLEEPEKLAIREIPLWPLETYDDPDLVLVEVKACGICGSDLRYYEGENPWSQHTLGRHVDNPPNIVPGHEFTGTVVAVLDEENRSLLGQRVAPLCSKVCGACRHCLSNRAHLCPNTVHLGHGQGWGKQAFYPGAYAEYVPAWGKGCYTLPEPLSFTAGAMMDILAVCTHVTRMGGIEEGAPVLVLGAGPAGNGIAQIAKILGASKVALLDRSATAVAVAKKCGIPEVIDTSKVQAADEAISERLGPHGAMSIFDAIGTEWSIQLGLRFLDKGGTLVNMAVHDAPIAINPMALGGERRMVTSCNFRIDEYPETLGWLAEGRIEVKPWITTVRRNEVPETFERLLEKDKGGSLFKVVIV